MSKKEELLRRRQNLVPQGVGVFNPSTVVEAKGAVLTDADGNKVIDFGGGIGVLNAGYCPEPVVQAICEQAQKLIHACFHVATYEQYLDLCELLIELFPHGEQTKVMLTNTGAESVENAVKIARQATGKSGIIAYTGAFHGRSMMAMTLTSKTSYKLGCGPFAPEVYRLPYPNFYKFNDGLGYDEFIQRELRRFKHALVSMTDASNVAAVIIELVQGEGGFVIAPKEYIEGLRKICDENGILLIFDEVQTGFCRTGKWGALEHYGVTPDLSTWAKSMGGGMPIGAVIGKAKIMDAAKPGTIGGTYLGNPVSCAAAIANIKYMRETNLNERAVNVGNTVMERFKSWKNKYTGIGNVRGLGAMCAIEFVKNDDPHQPDAERVARLISACSEKGLLVLSAGTHKNVIRFLAPLVISDEDLKRGLDILEAEIAK
jgi:4-aminobutyrate aminotransferase/(S)-3-amino-2-methylpropionate transaminase